MTIENNNIEGTPSNNNRDWRPGQKRRRHRLMKLIWTTQDERDFLNKKNRQDNEPKTIGQTAMEWSKQQHREDVPPAEALLAWAFQK